jgi:hypothetical protein
LWYAKLITSNLLQARVAERLECSRLYERELVMDFQPPESYCTARAADHMPDADSGNLHSYGITAAEVITYEWGGYRYTNAADVLAEAKRASK